MQLRSWSNWSPWGSSPEGKERASFCGSRASGVIREQSRSSCGALAERRKVSPSVMLVRMRLTTKEACAHLGSKSEAATRALLKGAGIPSIRVGHAFLWDEDAVCRLATALGTSNSGRARAIPARDGGRP
jgi:hypothetical protein